MNFLLTSLIFGSITSDKELNNIEEDFVDDIDEELDILEEELLETQANVELLEERISKLEKILKKIIKKQ